MKIKAILSDGSQPVGNGIGPNLEARDVLYVLKRNKKAPKDLEKKSLLMTSVLLKMVGIKNSYKKAQEILDSGLAYKKMKEIIKAQNGNPNIDPNKINLGNYTLEVKAKKSGKIKRVDNKLISKISRIAGSPLHKEAGIYLYKHIGDKVKKNELLFTIHSINKERLNNVKKYNYYKVIKIIQ